MDNRDYEKESNKNLNWVWDVLKIKKTWSEKSWKERIITILTFGIKTYRKVKGV